MVGQCQRHSLDNTVTVGDEQIQLPAACLNVSGTTTVCEQLGNLFAVVRGSAAACSDAVGGGCTCSVTIKQSGGLGLVNADPYREGQYATSGNVVTLDSQATYSYCVSGDTLTWMPQTMGPTVTGAIILHR